MINKQNQQHLFLGARTFIEPENILFLEAEINYTNIYYQNGRNQLLSITLKRVLEAIKDEGNYVRISHKHAINKACIKTVTANSVRITGGKILKASRRKSKTLSILNGLAS